MSSTSLPLSLSLSIPNLIMFFFICHRSWKRVKKKHDIKFYPFVLCCLPAPLLCVSCVSLTLKSDFPEINVDNDKMCAPFTHTDRPTRTIRSAVLRLNRSKSVCASIGFMLFLLSLSISLYVLSTCMAHKRQAHTKCVCPYTLLRLLLLCHSTYHCKAPQKWKKLRQNFVYIYTAIRTYSGVQHIYFFGIILSRKIKAHT